MRIRKSFERRQLFVSAIFFFLGILPSVNIAWGDVGASGAAPVGKKFTFRMRGEPETLDWNRAHTIVEADILMNIMEGLVTFDANSKILPALAESWNISPDGKIYTFKLRAGVKWSDDIPLKAQDFVYSWKRLLAPMTAASYAYILYDIEGAEAYNKGNLQDFSQVGIKALDDLTFQVKLSSAIAQWIFLPAFWVTFPLRQDIIEKYGGNWATPGRMVVLGPYYVETHDVDSKFSLRANTRYYGIRGNVDEVTGLIVKDDALALTLYEAGQLDFLTDLASIDLKRLAGRADMKTYPQLKTQFLGFVTEKYPVSNLKFRRAIAMAIDKSKIKQVLYGEQQPATSFVPPTMLGYSKNLGLPFDPTLAKAELKASGVETSGTLVLSYLLPDWDRSIAIATFVQSELKQNLGLEVTLIKTENKAYRSQLDLLSSPLFDASWTADYPDSDNFLSMYLSTSGNSHTGWKSEVFDKLVQTARRTPGSLEREKMYLELQRILLEEAAVIVPLYYEPNLALVRPRVKTFELNSLGYLYLRRVNVGT